MRLSRIPILPVLILSVSCAGQSSGLDMLIERHGQVADIWQYEYRGGVVYYVPLGLALGNDAFSQLHAEDGELICMPDGGITGRGDGRCPDFDALARQGELVWRSRPANPIAIKGHESAPTDARSTSQRDQRRRGLSPTVLDRHMESPVTTRNWRTVLKLDEMIRDTAVACDA